MNAQTYEALKRIMLLARQLEQQNYFKNWAKEIKTDIKQVENWIDEVAKEYDEDNSLENEYRQCHCHKSGLTCKNCEDYEDKHPEIFNN